MPDKDSKDKVIEYHAPKPISLPRPQDDLPFKSLKPTISPVLLLQTMNVNTIQDKNDNNADNLATVSIGTMCKNSGCKQV